MSWPSTRVAATYPALLAAINRLTGFAADDRRAELTAGRIAPVLAAYGLRDLDELTLHLDRGVNRGLEAAVVDAVVIGETLFFRDRSLWEALRGLILPALLQARSTARTLRIWSAACSTGQEPYSFAMLLDEAARSLSGWTVDLRATDVSAAAIGTARAGVFSHFEVQRGLSTPQLLRYFAPVASGWEIAAYLRAAVAFSRRNLLSDFAGLGTCDIVSCRNVLMYMDMACRRAVLARIADLLAPDGYLILGAAETLVGVTDLFVPSPHHPSILVRRAAVDARV